MTLKYTKADERDIAFIKPIYERFIKEEIPYEILKMYLYTTEKRRELLESNQEAERSKEIIACCYKDISGSWFSLAEWEWLLHRDSNKFQAYLRRAFRLHRTSFEINGGNTWYGRGLAYHLSDYWACGAWNEVREGFNLVCRVDEKEGRPSPFNEYHTLYFEPDKPQAYFEEMLKRIRSSPFQDKSYEGWKMAFAGLITYDEAQWHAGMKQYLRYFKSTYEGQGKLFCLRGIKEAMLAKARGLQVNFDHRLAPAELQIPYSVDPGLEATYPTSGTLYMQAYERDIEGRIAPRVLWLYGAESMLAEEAKAANTTEEQILEIKCQQAYEVYQQLKAGTFPFDV